MRGELYITQLIRLSDAAETYALSLRPPGAARHLSIREELDSLPLDQAERRFADLAKRLPELLESKPPPHFAESHLPKLFKRTARQALASVLGCTADDVLPTLLDPVPISREIENVAAQVRLSRPVAILVEDLLIQLNAEPVRRAIRHRWGFSETAWGRHLEARRWILPKAMDLLDAEAARRGWSDATTPTDALAGIIDQALGEAKEDRELSGGRFDAMGIAYVGRRVENLVSDLREEAVKHARQARDIAPGLGALTLLHGWIELYERQAVARALLTLSSGTIPLGSLVSEKHVQPIAVGGAIDPDSFFLVENLKEFQQGILGILQKRHFVTCDIQCRLKDQSHFETVLRIVGMPIEAPGAFEPVRRAIERLRGADLSMRGETIRQQLLNTEIAVPTGLVGYLRRWVEGHAALVAQTLVLCGIDKPFQARVPWDRQLKGHLEFAPEQTRFDVSFPKPDPGHEDPRQRIIDALVAECETPPRVEE